MYVCMYVCMYVTEVMVKLVITKTCSLDPIPTPILLELLDCLLSSLTALSLSSAIAIYKVKKVT